MGISRNITLFKWFNFFTDFQLYAPIEILYFAQVTGSYVAGMSIFSIMTISAALSEVPTGIFSDFIGRKRTIVLGALSAVVYTVFYAIGGSYIMLAIGAMLEGLSRSFYSGNNDALLHNTVTESGEEHKFHEYLGKTKAMFQIALAVSAVFGSFIAHISFSLVLWLTVIPQLICLFLSFQFIESKNYRSESGNIYLHLREAMQLFVKNKKLRLLSIASAVREGMGEATYQFQSAFYVMVWPIWALGFAKMISNVLASTSFYYSGKLIDRLGPLRILIAGNLYARIVNVIALVTSSTISPALMSTNSLFYGASNVSMNSLLQKEFTPHQRATMGSLNSFFGSISFAILAFLFGGLADVVGVVNAFLIAQIINLLPIAIYIKLFKHSP